MFAILTSALLHLYIAWRIAPQLPGAVATGGLLAWLVLSALLIPMGLMGRRARDRLTADRWSWAGMLALGGFSMLLVLTLLRDLLLLMAGLLSLNRLAMPGLTMHTAIAVPLLALAATVYGLISARRTARVRDVEVPIGRLPAALDGFTIAQITDVHVGPTVKAPYVRAIVDAVNRMQADAVAITGDLVDGRVRDLHQDVAPLGLLQSRHGSFFVTGNHEYYSGAPEWVALLGTLGVRVLTNEHVVIEHDGERVVMAGVTDYGAHQFEPANRSDPKRALSGAPTEAGLRVLLAHQPRTASAAADAGFDVQLSGHTHGGQFWPWNMFVPLQQPFTAGLHRLRSLWVYVSRGTGYWGPPLRLGAPSEITRLRFVQARS